MPKIIPYLVAAGVLALPAGARAAPSVSECSTFLTHIQGLQLVGLPSAVAGSDSDTCRYDDLELKTDTHGGYRADSVTVRGIGFDPGASTGPARTLRVDARGVIRVFHINQPMVEYMLSQQQAKLAVVLDITYDPGAETWVLHDASLDGERLGHVSVSGEVDGLGPIHDTQHPPAGLDSAAIRRMHLLLDSRVFIATFVLPSMIDRLPQAPTADAEEVAVRAETTMLAAEARDVLTASGASATTIAAVTTAITDFPHPRHPLDVTVTAANPLTVHDIAAAASVPGGLIALAKRIVVEATYAGSFSESRPQP